MDTRTREGLYLDDLKAGQTFVTGSHAVDAAQIKAFASQFDPQPFHTDEEAAKDTVFKELVAAGIPWASRCGCS